MPMMSPIASTGIRHGCPVLAFETSLAWLTFRRSQGLAPLPSAISSRMRLPFRFPYGRLTRLKSGPTP